MSESSEILDWGIAVVRWFQQFSPSLDLPFKTLTLLGNLEFFLLFMPLLYWCLDRRIGARLLVLFLMSAYINSVAKVIAFQPRPFEYDPAVKALVHAGGGGFPSGHTQGAVVVWGCIAAEVKKPSMWMLAGFLMVAIPLSRLYLGVHFPTDLLGGYLIGAALLLAYLRFAPVIEFELVKRGFRWQMAAAIGLPVGLILLSPAGARTAVAAGSVLLGFAPGMILERRWVRFHSGGSTLRRLLRFAVGMVAVVALWAGLRVAFAALTSAVFFQILCYTLIGLWCSLGAPLLFVRLKLGNAE